jgi:hypothetical protein
MISMFTPEQAVHRDQLGAFHGKADRQQNQADGDRKNEI